MSKCPRRMPPAMDWDAGLLWVVVSSWGASLGGISDLGFRVRVYHDFKAIAACPEVSPNSTPFDPLFFYSPNQFAL